MPSHMEEILGVSIGDDRVVIPGTVPVDGKEFVYFCDDQHRSFGKQFRALTNYTNPPCAQGGGVLSENCSLTLSDGSKFHAIGYHGDVVGWRKDIEEASVGLNVPLARIQGSKFVVSDGREFELSACASNFYRRLKDA